MPSAYSEDLRERVVKAYREGKGTQEEITEMFEISLSCLRSYLRLEEKTGSLAPKEYKRGPLTIIAGAGLESIKEWVSQTPDITLSELCDLYKKSYKKKVSLSMMYRALVSLGLRRKKKSFYAQEQEREDVKKTVKNM
jgi:transposase